MSLKEGKEEKWRINRFEELRGDSLWTPWKIETLQEGEWERERERERELENSKCGQGWICRLVLSLIGSYSVTIELWYSLLLFKKIS